MSAPSALRLRVLLFGPLVGWCASLLALRMLHSGTHSYRFLAWNLFLAALPLAASLMLARADRQKAPAIVRLGWAALWLCFLPNAPYIVTDFIHLSARPPVPLWFDVALLLSYAGTGLLLGWVSVADVQAVVERRRGALAGWLAAIAALMLSGFGIYVGRFLRWNSWDALFHPIGAFAMVTRQVAAIDEHPRTLAVTLVYGTGLLLGYAALRGTTLAVRGHESPISGAGTPAASHLGPRD